MRKTEIPTDFAQLLRAMQVREDPRLNALLAAARKKRWSTPALAAVLKLSNEATDKRIERAKPTAKDVVARQRIRAAARQLDDTGFSAVGDELRKLAAASPPAFRRRPEERLLGEAEQDEIRRLKAAAWLDDQLNKAKRQIAGVERAIGKGALTNEQAAIIAEDSDLNGRGVPRWKARLIVAAREIEKAREYEPTPPPDISDIEIPQPARGPQAMLDGRTLSDNEIAELRELARVAKHTNGAAEVGDEQRKVSEAYTKRLHHLTTPVDQGGGGFTPYYLAGVIGVTPRAITSRLERWGLRRIAPSIADGRYLNKKIGGNTRKAPHGAAHDESAEFMVGVDVATPAGADGRPYVCDTDDCRVLLSQDGATGAWVHPPELRERFSDHVCDDPDPGRPATPGEIRYGRGRTLTNEKIAIYATIPELVPTDPTAPLIIATDGSYKLEDGENDGGTMRKPISWAYLSTGGQYGLGTTKLTGKLVGNKRSLQGELRAAFWALTKTPRTHPVTLITDSLDAVNLMEDWKAGGHTMPDGYDFVRENGRPSTLAQLAKRVNKSSDKITIQWVRSHTGHPMNTATDKLAKTARHWAMGRAGRTEEEAKARVERIAYKLALDGLVGMANRMAEQKPNDV